MTGHDLRVAAERLFGRYGAQTKLAKALKVDASTVRRWISGVTAVPGPVEAAVTEMLRNKRRRA